MNFFKTSSPAPAQTDPEANFSAPVNVATANTSVRVNFLRKVYTLLTINFLITIAVSCAFAFIIPVREFIVERRWLIVVALIVAVVALIALSCVKLAFPTNLIMMYVFVLAFSVTIGVIVASYYDNGYGPIVIQAFAATAAVFFAITAYILVTKKDFSFLYGFLGAALFVLIVLSIINFAFNATTGGRSRAFSFGISVAGVSLIMTGYLLYDTSVIVNKFGPDQWLTAVVSLYVDVTSIFLYLLNIFSFIDG